MLREGRTSVVQVSLCFVEQCIRGIEVISVHRSDGVAAGTDRAATTRETYFARGSLRVEAVT